jgi:hypothetical protein
LLFNAQETTIGLTVKEVTLMQEFNTVNKRFRS